MVSISVKRSIRLDIRTFDSDNRCSLGRAGAYFHDHKIRCHMAHLVGVGGRQYLSGAVYTRLYHVSATITWGYNLFYNN